MNITLYNISSSLGRGVQAVIARAVFASRNILTLKTIRAGFVFGVAIFMVTGTAFASVDVIYTEATNITTTSAVLNSQILSSNYNSSVWFEWSDNSSLYAPTISGNQKFGGKGGSFNTTIEGLTPGTTYYYRAVIVSYPIVGAAKEPVVSRTFSFKTLSPKSASDGIGTSQSNGSNSTQGNSTSGSQTNTSANTSTNTTSTNTNTTTLKNSSNVTTKKTVVEDASTSKDGFTNDGSASAASVIIAGDGIFPTTLIGWILLFITLLIILLIVRMIYEHSEKRKKARQIKKANGIADQEIEKEKKEEVKA